PIFTGTNEGFQGPIGLSQKPVLMKNYPNPFSTETTFEFMVHRATDITVRIFDVQGKFVTTAYSGFRPEGEFTWTWNTANLAPAMYTANLYDGGGNLLQSGKLLNP